MTWSVPELLAWIARIEARAADATMFELLGLGSNADSTQIVAAFHRIGAGAHPDLHRGKLEPKDADRLVSAYGKVAAAYDTLRDPAARERYRKELAERGRGVSKPPVLGGASSTRSSSSTTGPRPAISASRSAPSPSAPSPSVPRASSPPGSRPPAGSSSAATIPVTRASSRPPIITPPPTAGARGSGAGGAASKPAAAGSTPPPSSSPTQSPTMPVPSRTASETRQGVGPRATAYFRKAQSCLARGDLGGALFNLRLASAADPTSSILRVALAEVEAEIAGKK